MAVLSSRLVSTNGVWISSNSSPTTATTPKPNPQDFNMQLEYYVFICLLILYCVHVCIAVGVSSSWCVCISWYSFFVNCFSPSTKGSRGSNSSCQDSIASGFTCWACSSVQHKHFRRFRYHTTLHYTTAQHSTPYHSEMKQQQNIILSLQDFNIEILKNSILRPYQGKGQKTAPTVDEVMLSFLSWYKVHNADWWQLTDGNSVKRDKGEMKPA